MEKIRLQKFISDCGAASRRMAEKLIAAGSVTVNGRVASIGDKVDPFHDLVHVDGKALKRKTEYKYIMLNKPRGFVTTMSDEKGRKCVASLLDPSLGRLYPVGRLDMESEGLLLMTDDGEFANAVMHPSHHIDKTYRVTVHPEIDDEKLAVLTSGMKVDGEKTSPAIVKPIKTEEGKSVFLMTIHEGKNRQIRKMCAAVGLEVAKLKRVSIGELRLSTLHTGKYRELTRAEVEKILKKTK